MKKCLIALLLLLGLACGEESAAQSPLQIGWIGPMSGPNQKYAAYQAAMLAEEDINAAGGVGGRKLELLFQDGKGSNRDAVSAAHYLMDVAKVRYLVGGHCSPESLPIAPLAEQNKTLMLAAITSSPKLTAAGDFVFRVTAVNTQGVDKLLPYLRDHSPAKRFGVLYEETDYAQGLGDYFRDHAPEFGISVPVISGYAPGEQEFRALLTRMLSAGIDGLYLSVQAPDSAATILQRMNELHFKVQLVGNEIAGNAVAANRQSAPFFEGLVFAEPDFNAAAESTRAFIERYKKRFQVDALPFGIWTAEAYDAVRVLAATIERCGDDVDNVKRCLYETKEYPGVSGAIGFDVNGDGIRQYVLKVVHAGTVERR